MRVRMGETGGKRRESGRGSTTRNVMGKHYLGERGDSLTRKGEATMYRLSKPAVCLVTVKEFS